MPGEKIQMDVKEVPFNCLRGAVLRDNKHLYQWSAIDELNQKLKEHLNWSNNKTMRTLGRKSPV